MAPAIKYSTSLVHLDLSSNELTAKGGAELFKSLTVNESIVSLDVSSHEGLHRNHLATKGVKWLTQVLKHNKILTILNLSGNSIKIEGLAYIAEGIAGNNTLLSLEIAQNEIQGSPQCVQLLKTIITESKIKELNISDNQIGNSSMESLSQNLANTSMALQRLYASNVGITCILFILMTYSLWS
jgi:Ran GTPase-activating protein (RanGAP) involved in mRNA processing and transport